MDTEVVIIGAGAAGLMCAITAAKRGRKVIVLEQNDRIGKKILISGGGRCNFTNLYVGADDYLSEKKGFCKSALAGFTPRQMMDEVAAHGITWHEKKLGQLFCDETSRQITDMFLEESEKAGVRILLNKHVEDVEYGEGFRVRFSQGDPIRCKSVVVATGGLSFPKLGISDFGYRLAEKFGLRIVPLRPGLVPLLWSPKDLKKYASLSGVSIDALVSCRKKKFRENILFTHRGLSGPAILQISSYWKEGDAITINLSPDAKAEPWLLPKQSERTLLEKILSERLPKRFVQTWCEKDLLPKPMNEISLNKLRDIAHHIHHWEITPRATEGYDKAEVTAGGIDVKELSSKTMEARRVSDLYFIGEVVDVTGHLGGFNFQWAWASGFAAGKNV